MQGAALEGLVAVHLKTWMDYSQSTYTLSFWRTRSGLEVDFIVYGEHGFWAIEVKNSKNIGFADTKGLEAFLKDYPMARAILLYRGNETLQQKNVLCIPVDEFLQQLRPDQSLWTGLLQAKTMT
jgi:predicted AAA+ superfamily ATPase